MKKFARLAKCGIIVDDSCRFSGFGGDCLNGKGWVTDPTDLIEIGDFVVVKGSPDVRRVNDTKMINMIHSEKLVVVSIYKMSRYEPYNMFILAHRTGNSRWTLQ